MNYTRGVMVLACTFLCTVYSHQEILLKAQSYYEEKNFKQALSVYDSIIPKSRAIWYNMGNCAYNVGHYFDALLYWLRAYQQASRKQRSTIQKNILQLEGKISTTVDLSYFDEPLCDTSLLLLQVLFLILWGLLLWSLMRAYKKNKYLLLLIIAVLWSSLAAVIFLRYRASYVHCSLVRNEVSLCAGPHNQYHAVGVMQPAQLVAVIQHTPEWSKVKQGTTVGWVQNKDLVKI